MVKSFLSIGTCLRIPAFLLLFLLTPFLSGAQSIEKETEAGISERALFEFNQIKDPKTGKIPVNAHWQALMETKQAVEFFQNTAARSTALSWIERGPSADVVGPSNGNTRPNNGVTAGRMRAVLVDRSDASGKTVWVGGVDGGLWKTTDITVSPANWTVINDYLSNLAITGITQDPTNSNIMYFCTGEAYSNADAVAGEGVFKSTDHGLTWSQLTSTSNYTRCTRILCDYLGNVYLATRSYGLLRSTNGGLSWTTITPSGMSANIGDLEISSTSGPGRLHVVAGLYGITQSYRYTDVPSTASASTGWTSPATPFPSYSNRAEIACSGNVLYACPADGIHQVPVIYKSTDGGANWTATATQPSNGTWANGQGWYSLAVGIDPTNSNNCIVGGLENYKTTDGGSTWTKISNWVGTTGQYVHADMHDIVWYDNGNKLLFACDGGIHYSSNGGSTIRDRNNGLRIKQFYSVAVHPTSPDYFLAGAQDNGTHKLNTAGIGTSTEVTGGDGAYVAIDQNQPQYQFGAYVYNQYRRSTDGGNSWSSINLSSSAGLFINPFTYDDVNNRIYACYNAGTYLRWDNPQTGNTASAISISDFSTGKASAIKVSPFTANRVFFGTTGGRIVRVDNAHLATPTSTNISSASMSGYVSCVNTGTSDQYLIASFSSYNVNNVWVSTNGGTSWTAVDGNLPNMPVRWCMFEPNDNTAAIIATETGVWETAALNGASTIWIPSLGFPSVRTDMLAYRPSDGLLAAGTHGRGVFSTIISSSSASCGNPAGLATSTITHNSATLSWTAVTGATSYDVDYKLNGSSTWINAATATTLTSISLSGLQSSSLYVWQVRANCPSASSSYIPAQFTTTEAPVCNAPTGLNSTNVTDNAATISWTPASGAVSYRVDYKLNSSSSWITAASATTATSVNLSSLVAASTYDWRVMTNCTESSSNYIAAQFTTSSSNGCPGIYDVSTNGTASGAATIPFNTDVFGTISSATDADYYEFVVTNGGTATLTLSNLPDNYDLYLYSSNGTTKLANSKQKKTVSESISRTYTPGTYFAKVVVGAGGSADASNCYLLRLQSGTASTQEPELPMFNENTLVKLYPNPATESLNISTSHELDENSVYSIFDVSGRMLGTEKFQVNPQLIDISKLIPGMYMIKVKIGEASGVYRFTKN